MIGNLSKQTQLVIFFASTMITILSYLMAYDKMEDVAWFPFAIASCINVLKSVVDYLMGRSPAYARDPGD